MLTYTWGNEEQTVVKVGGTGLWIPTDEANLDYAALLANEVEIEPYCAEVAEPRPVTEAEPWERDILARNGQAPP
jgi:hypothetical protein